MNERKGGVPRTIRKQVLGKVKFRLVEKDGRFFGLADGKALADGDEPDETWRLLTAGQQPGKTHYVGMDGAKKLFLHHYPNAFTSAAFEQHGERGYKVAAKAKLDETAPLLKAVADTGFSEPILAVFNATNLKSPFGKMRIKDVLRSKDADTFVQASARFTLNEDRKSALRDMERVLQPHGTANWTSVTYLPFLWGPREHMFLKPESTIDFAERVGHRFASIYSSALDLRVYDSLLDLAAVTLAAIADLGARDNIDVQSFIWVVSGAYNGEPPRP